MRVSYYSLDLGRDPSLANYPCLCVCVCVRRGVDMKPGPKAHRGEGTVFPSKCFSLRRKAKTETPT